MSTTPEPLTPDVEASLRFAHGPEGACACLGWPCTTARLLATLDAARATPAEPGPDLRARKAQHLLDALDAYERDWMTSGTGYGLVRTRKKELRAALAARLSETPR